MAWETITFEYAYQQHFEKHLLWMTKNANVYFGHRDAEDDDYVYYAGTAAHALGTGLVLTEYATEADAQTNYLTTTIDSDGKFLAVLPVCTSGRSVKMCIQTGSGVQIYEWRPSTYLIANELIAGELRITDLLSDAPRIKVEILNQERVFIGNLGSGVYGMRCRDALGEIIFETTNFQNLLAGWTFTDDYLYKLSSGTPGSSPDDGIVLRATNPALLIYEGNDKRIELGYLSSGVYGLKGYDTDGSTVIFELSDTQQMLAGWTFTDTYFYKLSGGTPGMGDESGGIVMRAEEPSIICYVSGIETKVIELGVIGDGDGGYGLVGYSAGGDVLFELSDENQQIAGWNFTATSFSGGSGANYIALIPDTGIQFGHETFGSAPFSVTKAGVLKAVSGTIGGLTLSSSALYTGSKLLYDDANAGVHFGIDGIGIGNNVFTVSSAGALVATSAAITGAITANSGTIGSFTIGTYLYTGSKTAYNDANAGVHLGSDGIGIGNNVFTVSSAGAITAVSGAIGGWTLAATTLSAGNLSLDSANTRIQCGASATDYVRIEPSGITGVSAVLGTTFNLPSDGSAPTFSSGIINETIFEIYTAGVIRTDPDVGSSKEGVLINNTGIKGYDTTPTLTFHLDATDGSLFVGDASSYMTWDTVSGLVVVGDVTAIPKYLIPSEVNLVGHWALNDGAGTIAIDSRGNANGTLEAITTNAVWSYADALEGCALEFGGPASGDSLKIADDSSLHSSSFSIHFAIKPDSYATNWRYLFQKKNESGKYSWRFQLATDGTISFIIFDYNTAKVTLTSSAGIYADGYTWTSVGVTCNHSTGLICLYINGELDDSDTTNGAYISGAGASDPDLCFSSPVDWASASNCYDGAVDNIRLYNTVLTANQMMALHLYPAEQGGGKISANILSAGMLQSSNYVAGSAGLAFDLDNAILTIYESEGLQIKAGAGIVFTGDNSSPGDITFEGSSYSTSFGCNDVGRNLYLTPSIGSAVDFYIGAGAYYFDEIFMYVADKVRVGGNFEIYQASTTPYLQFIRASTKWQLSVDSSYTLNIGSTADARLSIDTSGNATFIGNIDISRTTADPTLILTRSSYIYSLSVNSSDQLLIKDGSTTRLTLNSSGEVILSAYLKVYADYAGVWLEDSVNTGDGVLMVFSDGYLNWQRHSINFGSYEATLLTLDIQNADFYVKNDLIVEGDILRIVTSKTPGGSDAGSAGQICWDTTNLYIYTDNTNKWKKITLTDF